MNKFQQKQQVGHMIVKRYLGYGDEIKNQTKHPFIPYGNVLHPVSYDTLHSLKMIRSKIEN